MSRTLQRQKKLPKLRNKAEAIRVLDLIRGAVHSSTALGLIRDAEAKGPDPFKILIATILSARTRDSVTEKASDRLFAKYPGARALSRASVSTVAMLIKPVNFYTGKAARIVQTSKQIEEKYGGRVPRSYDELMDLPGVGRKTAGCVLVYGFGEPAIPVDVHVRRISNRIGLVNTVNPEETEVQLLKLYDRKHWISVNELFVSFGQTVCVPIRPKCEICPVRPLCNYYYNHVVKKKRG
ncbi:MAG: endonuclease III domain-containing protein [Nitrososphaerales archaeon]